MQCAMLVFKVLLDTSTGLAEPQTVMQPNLNQEYEEFVRISEDEAAELEGKEVSNVKPLSGFAKKQNRWTLQSRYPVYWVRPDFVYRLPYGSLSYCPG
jgi:hypothetical protein